MIEWILNKDNTNYLIVIATIIGPIIASIIALIFQLVMKKFEEERWIEDRLFSIQKIAFEYPFVEDEMFISKWDDFVKNYRQNKLDDEQKKELDKYLRYEQYGGKVDKMKKYLNSPTIQLTLSQIISLGFAFISSIIIANSLGLEKFGSFTFYFSITSIFLLFFRFGYFSSIGVLVVKTNNKRR